MKAELMLRQRKDPYNVSMTMPKFYDKYEDWYIIKNDRSSAGPSTNTTKVSSSVLPSNEQTEEERQRLGMDADGSSSARRKVTSYLTANGEQVTGPPDRSPGRKKSMQRKEKLVKRSPKSVFLTEINSIPSTTLDYDELLDSPSLELKRWQPLSASALLEHTRVTARPVSGLGELGHGVYRMWRPDSVDVNMNRLGIIQAEGDCPQINIQSVM